MAGEFAPIENLTPDQEDFLRMMRNGGNRPVNQDEEQQLLSSWQDGYAPLPGAEDFGDASDQVADKPLPYYAKGNGSSGIQQ